MPGRGNDLVGATGEFRTERHDLPTRNGDIGDPVHSIRRIDDPPASDQQVERLSHRYSSVGCDRE